MIFVAPFLFFQPSISLLSTVSASFSSHYFLLLSFRSVFFSLFVFFSVSFDFLSFIFHILFSSIPVSSCSVANNEQGWEVSMQSCWRELVWSVNMCVHVCGHLLLNVSRLCICKSLWMCKCLDPSVLLHPNSHSHQPQFKALLQPHRTTSILLSVSFSSMHVCGLSPHFFPVAAAS